MGSSGGASSRPFRVIVANNIVSVLNSVGETVVQQRVVCLIDKSLDLQIVGALPRKVIHQSGASTQSDPLLPRDRDVVVVAFTTAFRTQLMIAGASRISRPPRRRSFHISTLTGYQGPLNAEIRRKDEMRVAGCPIIRERISRPMDTLQVGQYLREL